MDRGIITSDKVLEYIYEFARILKCKIFEQFVAYCSLSPFNTGAFGIRIPADLKVYALPFK